MSARAEKIFIDTRREKVMYLVRLKRTCKVERPYASRNSDGLNELKLKHKSAEGYRDKLPIINLIVKYKIKLHQSITISYITVVIVGI